ITNHDKENILLITPGFLLNSIAFAETSPVLANSPWMICSNARIPDGQKLIRLSAGFRCNVLTIQRFKCRQAAVHQLNRGGDNDGDDGGDKSDARYTRSIASLSDSTNTAGNKSSTGAGSTRMDNNCSASDRHNGTPEIQN